MPKPTFHIAVLANGKLDHAVERLSEGVYAGNSVCGRKVIETKRKRFTDDSGEGIGVCLRCLGGVMRQARRGK